MLKNLPNVPFYMWKSQLKGPGKKGVNPLTPEFSEKNLQRIGHDHKNVIAGCYFTVDIAIHTFLKSIIIVDFIESE